MNKSTCFIIAFAFCIVQIQAQPWSWTETISFENIPLPIVIDSTAENIWQIGTPSKSFMDSAYSTPLSILTDTIDPYPVDNISCFTLIIDEQDLPWIHSYSKISFIHKYDTDSLFDGGYVEVSYDEGHTWYNVVCDTFSTHREIDYFFDVFFDGFYSVNDTLNNGIPAFSGKSKGWVKSQIDYTFGWVKKSYVDKVLFRFCFQSDQNDNQREGWIIDDINLNVYRGTNLDYRRPNPIHIYPNPLTDQSIIRSSSETDNFSSVKIYDITGRLIQSQNVNENKYRLIRDDFSPGIYLLLIEVNSKVLTSKLIVK